jgi:hypothetical protein
MSMLLIGASVPSRLSMSTYGVMSCGSEIHKDTVNGHTTHRARARGIFWNLMSVDLSSLSKERREYLFKRWHQDKERNQRGYNDALQV